jgi:hypothetical protein
MVIHLLPMQSDDFVKSQRLAFVARNVPPYPGQCFGSDLMVSNVRPESIKNIIDDPRQYLAKFRRGLQCAEPGPLAAMLRRRGIGKQFAGSICGLNAPYAIRTKLASACGRGGALHRPS